MLKSLIRSLGLSGTAQEITTALNAKTVQKQDDELWTWAGVADVCGPTGAETLRQLLEGSGMGWVNLQLGGKGIQLSSPLVQQALYMFGQMGNTCCNDLAARGVWSVSPYVNAGGTGDVLLADVQTAIDEIEVEQKTIDWRTRFDAAMNTLGTVEEASGIADIRAIADEMEGV